ncbi:hypothetical protein BDA99DRAFT_562751 [Phascolomyces articulosus]|uniref:Uncharacterized protein n=1 Tax=Phascolomyces articulosus TaxID=60185 RepID=A0AAD5PB05_9FUNG|nr:hypothetical protein BDA99DRAFT_562751 [Phascolomyces articulosus]
MGLLESSESDGGYDVIANGKKSGLRSTTPERERTRQRRAQKQQQTEYSQTIQPTPTAPYPNANDDYDGDADMGWDGYDGEEGEEEEMYLADTEDLGELTPSDRRRKRPKLAHIDDRKTLLVKDWATLLPSLKQAYLRSIGVNKVDRTALHPPPIEGYAGARTYDIQFCQNEGCSRSSLPVSLMEKQLFPTTPSNPNIAFHIEVLRCYNNVRLYARAPVNSIVELMKADYNWTALLNYSKLQLLVENELNHICDIEDGNCPFCNYMSSEGTIVPVSLDGNFQLKRLGHSHDPQVDDPCAKIVNKLWVAKKDIVISGYKRGRPSFNNTDKNTACEGWKSLSKSGTKKASIPTTGVFMAMCSRHSFVLTLMDMDTTGEK